MNSDVTHTAPAPLWFTEIPDVFSRTLFIDRIHDVEKTTVLKNLVEVRLGE